MRKGRSRLPGAAAVRLVRASVRRLGLALLAAVVLAFAASTLLVAAWLSFDGSGVVGDSSHASLGLFSLALAYGGPIALLFALVVAPLAALAKQVHAGWSAVVSAVGAGGLVLLTTGSRLAVLGGLVYTVLEQRFFHPAHEREESSGP